MSFFWHAIEDDWDSGYSRLAGVTSGVSSANDLSSIDIADNYHQNARHGETGFPCQYFQQIELILFSSSGEQMEKFAAQFNANREGWNLRTPHHVKSDFYDVRNFIDGATSLRFIEIEELAKHKWIFKNLRDTIPYLFFIRTRRR